MLVLFDLDDTLLDHRSASLAAATDLYAETDAFADLVTFLAAWSEAQERCYARYCAGDLSFVEQRRARLRAVIAADLSDAAADQLSARYLEVYQANWALFPDVLPCLETLSRRHRLGIISNGDGAAQRSKLARTGLTAFFDPIVLSGECGLSKPDARLFLHACALGGHAPEEALCVGDRYDLDVEGARRAGLRGVWLDRDGRVNPSHVAPVIVGLEQLERLIED